MHQVEAFKGRFLNLELRVAAESWKGRGYDIQFRRMFRRIPNAEKETSWPPVGKNSIQTCRSRGCSA